MSKSIHLPGLNGLRAIAALSVLWGHTFQHDFGNWGIDGFGLPVVADGVTLFFVISGFLITYLLLQEQEQSQGISISKFYLRRILRIWPIYYLYMFIALSMTTLWSDPNIWYYIFFGANVPFILTVGIWPIVHYWSIGVEEQFYMFFPWIVKSSHGKNTRLLTMAITICALWLLCKWSIYLGWGTTTVYRFFSVTRFDCMMIGAIGAILYFSKDKWFNQLMSNRLLGLLCLLLLFFSQLWIDIVPAPMRSLIIALLSLGCIMSQLYHPIINLENRVCDFVGKISYGIYIIHPLLIFLLSGIYRSWGFYPSIGLATIFIYLLVTLSTIFIAWLSYRLYESPFLRLKNRFAIIHSQNSINYVSS